MLAVIRPEQVLLDDAAGGQWLIRLQAGSLSLQARLPGTPTLSLEPAQHVAVRVQGPVWCLPADGST